MYVNLSLSSLQCTHTAMYPLHQAIEDDDLDKLRELLESGHYNVNYIEHDSTPVLYALRHGSSTEMVELLIQHDADLSIRDTSLVDPDDSDFGYEGDTILMAVFEEWPPTPSGAEKLKLLLDHGSPVDVWDDEECTPLFMAVRFECVKRVGYLLSAGAVIAREGEDDRFLIEHHCDMEDEIAGRQIVEMLEEELRNRGECCDSKYVVQI